MEPVQKEGEIDPLGAERPPRRSREVRIGLVLYGGVSLAVYINGCAREFHDLVRGRGIWGVIQELTDADVTVDVISGASAGGINGLFLSYALCRECELAPLARLWRERAGLSELLADAGDTQARSVLNSDYMERELAAAFEAMDRSPPVAFEPVVLTAGKRATVSSTWGPTSRMRTRRSSSTEASSTTSRSLRSCRRSTSATPTGR